MGYPRPAFALDALWNIVSVDLANYADAFPAITVGEHFFDLLAAYPRRLPKTARAELHTWEMEAVRALTYFEYFAAPRDSHERARHRALIAALSERLSASGKIERFTLLRQEARGALQRLRDRYTAVTFAAPVRVCTLSLHCPYDRLLILRFHCSFQAVVSPTAADPPLIRYRVTLLPQNDLTEEALGVLDHWKVDVIKREITGYDDIIHALMYMERENPYRGPIPEDDASPAGEIARAPEPRLDRPAPTRTEEAEGLADALAALGVPFELIPQSVYPGMRYVTPLALVESGVTRYSQRHILTLVRAREITAVHLADKVVLDPFGVQQLLDREAASAAENERAGGRRPGPRRPRAHRPARTA